MMILGVFFIWTFSQVPLIGAEKTLYIEKGGTIKLVCPIEGGMIGWKGPPKFMLYGFGIEVFEVFAANFTILRNETTHLSSLTIEHFSGENEGKYKCYNFTEDYEFVLTIKRDPTHMTIGNETERGVLYGVEYKPLTLQCNVNSGEPKERLQWYKGIERISDGGPGSLKYQLNGSWSDHKTYYTCKAINSTEHVLLRRRVQLYIIRKPKVTLPAQLTTAEGENFTQLCSHKSNDPVTEVRWFKHNIKLPDPLEFRPVTRSDSGNYKCQVTSRGGTDNNTVYLLVKYPPDVTILEEENQSHTLLRCKAKGIPGNYSYRQWGHITKYGQHLRLLNGSENGTLRIDNLKDTYYKNIGIYICTVTNGVPGIDKNYYRSANHSLNVSGGPVFLQVSQPIQFAVFGTDKTMTAYVFSNPEISTIFVSDDKGQWLTKKTKVDINSKGMAVNDVIFGNTVSVQAVQIQITVYNLMKEDFMNYTVYVRNSVSSSSFVVELNSANKPEPPDNVIAVGHGNTIKVSWTAGFDGGYPQTFVIQYMSELDPNGFIMYCERNDTAEEKYLLVIRDLEYSALYFIRVYSYNTVNQSDHIQPDILVETGANPQDVNAIIIAMVIMVLVVSCVVLVATILYKKGYLKRIISRGREFFTRHFPDIVVGVVAENEEYQLPELPLPPQVSSGASNQLYSSIDRRRCIELGQMVSYISNGDTTDQYQQRLLQCNERAGNNNLNYIDVCFNQPIGLFHIRGDGNRTPYADIDFNHQLIQVP